MAKKQTKAGILKRRSQKNIKKTKQRKASSKREQSNFNTQKNISKILVKVPYLIYEPELENFEFDRERISQYQAEGLSHPEIILNLIDEELCQSLLSKLQEIQSRYDSQSQKSLMIQGLFYFFEQNIPFFVNPIIVSIYLQTCARMVGESIPIADIIKTVTEYEKMNQPIIEKLATDMQGTADEVQDEGDSDIEDAKPLMVSSEVMNAFYQEFDNDICDDVDVFVEDYANKPLAEWDLQMVKDFQVWFKQNMNPLEEDIANMQESLKHFFQYLNKNQHLSEDQTQTIIPLFT